ncbi:MAG: EamA family transporter [Curvibacter sp.]
MAHGRHGGTRGCRLEGRQAEAEGWQGQAQEEPHRGPPRQGGQERYGCGGGGACSPAGQSGPRARGRCIAPAWGWVVLVLLTGVGFLLANLGLQYGAARLPAATTALVMLTEVVFASVSSVLLGASDLKLRTLLGGTLILLAALWAAKEEH